VSLEWFSRLKEYDSLSRSRLGLLAAIKEQEERLSALDKRQADSLSQLTNLKGDYVRLQQDLQELEAKMKLLSQQKERWIDQGGDDKKRISMEEEIAGLEDKGMELLQILDTNEVERRDTQTFLEGLKKTYDEIASEVVLEVTRHRQEIEQLDLRQSSLLEILPPEYKDLLMRTLKKNPVHGPFTRIESGTCFFCRFKISRVDESEIDMQKKLKTCPQCGRIFIPYGT
jgi:predicted  nucleic acid-binding Zn-ribbon protein